MKTAFELLVESVLSYAKAMRARGVKKPVFLMTNEAAELLGTVAALPPFGPMRPCHSLPESAKKIPGVVGEIDGVLLVVQRTFVGPR